MHQIKVIFAVTFGERYGSKSERLNFVHFMNFWIKNNTLHKWFGLNSRYESKWFLSRMDL